MHSCRLMRYNTKTNSAKIIEIMSREEMIISALVDLVNAKNENIKNFESKIIKLEAKTADLENILDTYDNQTNDKISLVKKKITFTEEELLRLVKVQSNIDPNDFRELFGENKGSDLFRIFAGDSWNLISFMFNKINGEDRDKLLKMINNYLNK